MKTYTIKEAWVKACEADNIPPDSSFVVFSDNNEWAKRYNKAIELYLACKRQGVNR